MRREVPHCVHPETDLACTSLYATESLLSTASCAAEHMLSFFLCRTKALQMAMGARSLAVLACACKGRLFKEQD